MPNAALPSTPKHKDLRGFAPSSMYIVYTVQVVANASYSLNSNSPVCWLKIVGRARERDTAATFHVAVFEVVPISAGENCT